MCMNLPKLIVVFAVLIISSITIVILITGATTFSFNQDSVSGQDGLKKDMVGGHTPRI